MIIHCCLNRSESIKADAGQKIFVVEFTHRGYWSKKIAAYDAKDAKRILLEEKPEVEYNRAKRIKK